MTFELKKLLNALVRTLLEAREAWSPYFRQDCRWYSGGSRASRQQWQGQGHVKPNWRQCRHRHLCKVSMIPSPLAGCQIPNKLHFGKKRYILRQRCTCTLWNAASPPPPPPAKRVQRCNAKFKKFMILGFSNRSKLTELVPKSFCRYFCHTK